MEYTKEYFLSTAKPYDRLDSAKSNPSLYEQVRSNARKVGVRGFDRIYRLYENAKKLLAK